LAATGPGADIWRERVKGLESIIRLPPTQAEMAGEGYDGIRDGVLAMVRGHFRPEFVNRIDEFIVFQPLRKAQIESIVRFQARRVAERLTDKKMALTLTDAAAAYLAHKGFDPVYGARPVKRVVQKELETALAKAILRGDFGPGDTVVADAPGGEGAAGLELRRGEAGAGELVGVAGRSTEM